MAKGGNGGSHGHDKHDADKGSKHSQYREHEQSSWVLRSRSLVLARYRRACRRIGTIYLGRIHFLIVERDSRCKHTSHHYHPYSINHGNFIGHIFFLVRRIALRWLSERMRAKMVPAVLTVVYQGRSEATLNASFIWRSEFLIGLNATFPVARTIA